MRGKPINTILDIDGIDNMNGKNVIDGMGRRDAQVTNGDEMRTINRMVSISVLATFLRDFPLTYLTTEERRLFVGFQDYIVHLEGQLFEEAGVGR